MNRLDNPFMHLDQSDSSQIERFYSVHSLHYLLPGNQTILMLSGIVEVNLRAPGWSEESATSSTYQEDLTVDLAVPNDFLVTGQSFKITQAVPYIGLNSLSGSAHTSWGVNNFSVETEKPVTRSIRLQAKLDVSCSGEVLKRIAYQVTLLGMVSN
jgi:hypothetical protein